MLRFRKPSLLAASFRRRRRWNRIRRVSFDNFQRRFFHHERTTNVFARRFVPPSRFAVFFAGPTPFFSERVVFFFFVSSVFLFISRGRSSFEWVCCYGLRRADD